MTDPCASTRHDWQLDDDDGTVVVCARCGLTAYDYCRQLDAYHAARERLKIIATLERKYPPAF